MQAINRFLKRIESDKDYTLRDSNTWSFPSLNIRIVNKEGQGYIVTNLPGNSHSFSLTSGHLCIGAAELNGILYLVSYNEVHDRTEIGTFPSPDWTGGTNEFSRTYSALYNYGTTSTRIAFSTSLFGFSLDNVLNVILKPSYDNSTDIYMTDNTNPVMVINSGFKITGEITERVHSSSEFNGALNLIPSSLYVPNVELNAIEGGGRLQPGMVYVYIRYLTSSYTRTHFLSSCGPIQVYTGNTKNNIEGSQDKDWKTQRDNIAHKKIVLDLTNLDTSYKFFELGILRYSADYENGASIENCYLVSKYYAITSASMQITITGTEKQEVLTYEDLVAQRIPFSINKAHNQINDVYIGANWKKRFTDVDYDKLATFAALISCSGEYSDEIIGTYNQAAHYEGGYASFCGSKDYTAVYSEQGFFRHQIYPFGIVVQFSDNTETEVYPIQGSINGIPNFKGLYLFPSWVDNPDMTKTLKVEFNLSAAWAYYNANQSAFSNVIGIKFVRGERLDNLICQGVNLPCYDRFILLSSSHLNDVGFGEKNSYDYDSAYSIPLVDGLYPFNKYYYDPPTSVFESYDYKWGIGNPNLFSYSSAPNDVWTYRGEKVINTTTIYPKSGVFSPDIFFEEQPYIPDEVYIQHVQKIVPYYLDPYHKGSFFIVDDAEMIKPSIIGCDYNPHSAYTDHFQAPTSEACYRVDSFFIDKFVQRGQGRFSSYQPSSFSKSAPFELEEGDDKTDKIVNRSFATPRYIGLVDEEQANTMNDYAYSIINLYKIDHDDFIASADAGFSVYNTEYQEISELILIADAPSTHESGRGDCFLQKTFFRTSRWYGYDEPGVTGDLDISGDGAGYLDSNGYRYQHGMFMGIVTECKYNTAMRNEVATEDENQKPVTYSYIPKCFDTFDTLLQWVIIRDIAVHEAFQINAGYNRILPGKFYFGYDSNKPDSDDDRATNRYYFSNRHISGSFVDGYRVIGVSSYKDFNVGDGEINAILIIRNFLVSVQENAILQHFIDERVVKESEDDPTSNIILASSRSFLSEKFKKIGNVGIQHKTASYSTFWKAYGVDWKKRRVWLILPERSSTGSVYLSVKDLGKLAEIESELKTLFDSYYSYTDITNILPDDIVHGNGIVIGHDKEYDEILFTFLFKTLKAGVRGDRTLAFSETHGGFLGDRSYIPHLYVNTDDNMFSVEREISGLADGEDPDYISTNKFWRHNAENVPQTFYGTQEALKISFVVNGLKEKENTSSFKKLFESLIIDMDREYLSSIEYETEYQSGIYTFIDAENDPDDKIWEHAVWEENTWNVPIITKNDGINDDEYQDYSNFTGRWIKITLVYDPTTTPNVIFIKNVITIFEISLT